LAKEILVEMVFALGAGGVAKFSHMLAALKSRDFDKAADEILDSDWARDRRSARRAKELADLMRTLARQ
jgi:GH24 family phage-related lysozyme (muramidase)